MSEGGGYSVPRGGGTGGVIGNTMIIEYSGQSTDKDKGMNWQTALQEYLETISSRPFISGATVHKTPAPRKVETYPIGDWAIEERKVSRRIIALHLYPSVV